jgi:FtsP/CotA-like multicopper oxidase with cupredoxin domain
VEKTKKTELSRRSFLSKAGVAAAGAGALLAPSAWAAASGGEAVADPSAPWPVTLDMGATKPKYDPRALPTRGDKIHEYDIEVRFAKHEILPLVETRLFTFNGTYPGPEIRVKEGDWVRVNLTNTTDDLHTIHWHGVILANEMDGVPLGTQWAVAPGEKFTYLWRAQPAGTHFYHCHVMTTLHIQAGLVGSLIIESDEDPVRRYFPYTRDYTLVLTELDTVFVREEMEHMAQMSVQMQRMNANTRLMGEMNGRMMGQFIDRDAFRKAIKEGYVPPYVSAAKGRARPLQFDYFMINGKSYPMTDPMLIKTGETIRVRLINGGMTAHSMHLHGHDFWHVCQDGNPLAAPRRLNTVPVFPGTTSDIIIQGTNPGNWHFHDHSDLATTNNGVHPGGMMTMLMYEDMEHYGVTFKDVLAVDS